MKIPENARIRILSVKIGEDLYRRTAIEFEYAIDVEPIIPGTLPKKITLSTGKVTYPIDRLEDMDISISEEDRELIDEGWDLAIKCKLLAEKLSARIFRAQMEITSIDGGAKYD
jgi:hypothetical protein